MAENERKEVRSEERDELVDDALHKARQLTEQWKNRLTLDNLRLSERYLEDGIEFLLRLRGAKEPDDFYAVLHHDAGGGVPEGGQHPSAAMPDISRCDCIHGREQEAVLVGVVQFMEFPESIIPTLVRLESADEVFRRRAHSLYFSLNRGFVLGGSLVDRKLGLVVRGSAGGLHQLPSKVTETAAQLVDGLSRDDGEFQGWLTRAPRYIESVSRLRVVLGKDTIRVGAAEGADPGVELIDVVFGPFDFCPDPG